MLSPPRTAGSSWTGAGSRWTLRYARDHGRRLRRLEGPLLASRPARDSPGRGPPANGSRSARRVRRRGRASCRGRDRASAGRRDRRPDPSCRRRGRGGLLHANVGFDRTDRARPRSARSTGRSASCTRSGPARGSVVRRRGMPRVRSSTLMPGTDNRHGGGAYRNHPRVRTRHLPDPSPSPDVGTGAGYQLTPSC